MQTRVDLGRIATTKSINQQVQQKDVPLVRSMYLVFTRMPGESYRRRLQSLSSCLCVTSFQWRLPPLSVITSLVC